MTAVTVVALGVGVGAVLCVSHLWAYLRGWDGGVKTENRRLKQFMESHGVNTSTI